MCVFSSHGNGTTYRRPQNRTGAAGTARVVPETNPCQRWHERRKSEAGGDNMTHACKNHTNIQPCVRADTPAYSSPLSLLAFLLKHERTHWISSHSSWLEPPMAIAVGIHSPRMLGQLCWYWMRRSCFCLSLHAARDKNYMLLNSNLYSLLPKMHPTHPVFVSATTESSDFLCKRQ